MNHTRTCAIWALFVLLQPSFAGAAQVLKAIPDKVDLGTFNTFQIKETTVKVKNVGRKTFQIDRIKADCACIRTRIDNKNIGPGRTVEVKIAARERTGGKFSHDLLIIPTDTERYEPLKIRATGNINQPVFAKVGWEGKKLTVFDPNRPMKLGLVHKLSARPLIHITADDRHFNLRKATPEVNSKYFKLAGHKLEKLTASNDKPVKEKAKERLILSLKPKKKPKTGILKDVIRIELADNVGLEIPIECLIVGDIYAIERMIHFGNLSQSTLKKTTISFTNGAEVWSDLKWDIKGYLSDAIDIRQEKIVRTGSHIVVTLDVDRSKLSSLPKGYVFCRMKFYQKDRPDEAVELLVDGFNTKSED